MDISAKNTSIHSGFPIAIFHCQRVNMTLFANGTPFFHENPMGSMIMFHHIPCKTPENTTNPPLLARYPFNPNGSPEGIVGLCSLGAQNMI